MKSPARLIGKLLSAQDVGSAAIQSVLLQMLALLANVVTGVATARALGADGRGLYAAATALPTLFGLIAVAGLDEGVVVQLRRRPERTASTTLLAYAATLVTSTALAAVGYLVTPHVLGPHHADHVALCRAVLVFLHLTAFIALTRAIFTGRGQFLLANLTTFLPNLFHAVAICGLALAAALSVKSALAGLAGGYAAALCLLAPKILRETAGRLIELRAAFSDLWRFVRRAGPGDVLALFSGWADRLVLIPLLSAKDLGLYAVSLSLAQLVTVAMPATGILLSAMTGGSAGQAKDLHDTSLRLTIACLGALVLVLFPVAGELIRIVYGPEFVAATTVFMVLVFRSAAVRIGAITAQLYLASDRAGLQSSFRFAEVCMGAALLFLLVPAGGALGAAIALLAASLLRLGLLWLGLVTHLRVSFPRLCLNGEDLRAVRALFGQTARP